MTSAFDSVKPPNSWIRCAFDYVCYLFSLKSISYFLDSKYFQVFLMILYIFPEAGLVLFMSLYQWVGITHCRNYPLWWILFTSQRSTWSRFVQLLQPCRWLYVRHSQFEYFLQSNRTYGVVELSLWLVRVLSNVRSWCLYLEMMKWQHFLLKQLHQFFLFVFSSWLVLFAFTVCGPCGGRRKVFSDLYISLALWVGWSWSWWGTLFTDDQGGGDDDGDVG